MRAAWALIASLFVFPMVVNAATANGDLVPYSPEDGDAVFSETVQPPMPMPWEDLSLRVLPGTFAGSMDNDPRSVVTPQFLSYFRLMIVVNKATSGPSAQRMRIYDVAGGQQNLLYDFVVSTGREDSGQMTPTPVGVYTMDPDRFVPWPSARSNPDMKWAMYWDYEYTTRKSGYALHAAPPGTEGYLGRRASHGCIRMRYDDVKFLFSFLQQGYQGMVPRFQFDSVRGTTNREGRMVVDTQGQPVLRWGYQVLLLVINDSNAP